MAPAARRSWAPRGGSVSRWASVTNTSVGTTNSTNGARQPSHSARPPARIGPMNWPTEFAARCVPNTFDRISGG